MLAPVTRRLCALLVALPAQSLAAPDARDVARQHFRDGQKLYNQKQYDKAAEEFSAAYEAHALPGFLFNLGQCEKHLAHYERAVFFFDRFLREAPYAKNRETAQALLREARRALAAEQAASDSEIPIEAAAPPATTSDEIEELPLDIALVAPPPAAREVVPVYKRWWFWSIAAGAVAIAGTVVIAFNTGGETIERMPEGSLGSLDRR
jgi:tetratricopeptide (TPR) repeat protein